MSAPVAIVAITDPDFRGRVGNALKGLRWQVLEAAGGAEALAQLEASTPAAVILDSWFPDLEIDEFIREVETSFPDVELVSTDGSIDTASERPARARFGRRGELLYALRISQQWDGAAYKAPGNVMAGRHRLAAAAAASALPGPASQRSEQQNPLQDERAQLVSGPAAPAWAGAAVQAPRAAAVEATAGGLPEFHGTHPCLLEVYRRIRLVAPRKTPVLVQGPSGTGKELVARALHRLSPRSARPMVVLNCAAIPESLLEAELFGHTKGAFTGAVQGRSGRIEAASGGTLFLDEIGEMPLALQAKLLRFLEAGELQRIGENEVIKVDVRVIAASHQQLAQRASQGLFRTDLFFRLAVFLIETPPLAEHLEDLDGLAALFLGRLAGRGAAKQLSPAARGRLAQHGWPGNVRELAHVLERSHILAEDRHEISVGEIEFAALG